LASLLHVNEKPVERKISLDRRKNRSNALQKRYDIVNNVTPLPLLDLAGAILDGDLLKSAVSNCMLKIYLNAYIITEGVFSL
jgi:hypothetical protein